MPIKVSDFIQNIAAYPVLRVQDNTILGYAYATASNQAALEAVPINNRRAGLVLHNRTLYNYDLADTSDPNWGDVTNHKEIATRFSSYPVFPIGNYGSIGEALANAADDTVNFAVHRTTDNIFYKLASNNVVEWLLNSLIQAQIDAGNGTITSYVGDTGILGDFNNDGQVSTADLLIFLSVFGSTAGTASGIYLPTIVTLNNIPPISILNAAGTSTYTANTPVYFTLTSGVTVDAGVFTVNINTGVSEHYFEVTGTQNGSQVLVLNQFENIQYTIESYTLDISASAPSGSGTFIFGLKAEMYDGTTLLSSQNVEFATYTISEAGNFTIQQPSLININASIPGLTDSNVTKVRFKFYGKYSTNNAIIENVNIDSLIFKITP